MKFGGGVGIFPRFKFVLLLAFEYVGNRPDDEVIFECNRMSYVTRLRANSTIMYSTICNQTT